MKKRVETLADRLKRAGMPAPSEALRLRRREFFQTVAAGATVLAGSAALSGCGSDDVNTDSVAFQHGVASGDPQTAAVILWTRATPTNSARSYDLLWEVASDAGFSNIVRSGTATAAPETDFTAKVDATGLTAATSYYYRFRYGAAVSPVGRTKTLPSGNVSQVRLAVFSCSNFPAGFFNVYADAAQQPNVDAAVHLGDFIYEYSRAGYASANAAALGRLSDPDAELLTLADYRRRYAQYRSDPDLQTLTATVPLIAVWDDHEIANDAWRDGAENHQANEGDWAARKAAAIRAWHEWLPVRSGADKTKIWRSFAYGDLLALHMLDTRLVGRDQQLEITSYIGANGAFNGTAFATDLANPNRQLLGAEQLGWLQAQMQTSTATWQMLGQQVLMASTFIPAPIALQQITIGAYGALAQKAQTAPATLTPQEQAILAAPSIPYNLDAWDGYAAARETVLATARTLDKNLVVLAGDTHNAWGNNLRDLQQRQVGVEFGVSSVSSPGFEAVFPNEDPAVFAAGVRQLIPAVAYADTSRRGYGLITVTAGECRCDWRYVSTVASRSFSASVGRSLRVLPGAANRKLMEVA
jgi:alkaline phosphatase D